MKLWYTYKVYVLHFSFLLSYQVVSPTPTPGMSFILRHMHTVIIDMRMNACMHVSMCLHIYILHCWYESTTPLLTLTIQYKSSVLIALLLTWDVVLLLLLACTKQWTQQRSLVTCTCLLQCCCSSTCNAYFLAIKYERMTSVLISRRSM